jgi:hypothetical protein
MAGGLAEQGSTVESRVESRWSGEVVGLDATDRAIAAALVGLQRSSYAVEAEPISFDGIPPLRESVEELLVAGRI